MLDFQLETVRDETGMAIRLRVWHQDILELQQQALLDPVFNQIDPHALSQGRLLMFIRKRISDTDAWSRNSVWRGALLVQLSVWKANQDGANNNPVALFMERRPWQRNIDAYAAKYGVSVVPVIPPPDLRRFVRGMLPDVVIEFLRWCQHPTGRVFIQLARRGGEKVTAQDGAQESGIKAGPFAAAEYYGSLNLDNPERHSDFFFWQVSSLPGHNTAALFPHGIMPLDEDMWGELKRHDVMPIPLRDSATSVPEVPAFKALNRNATTDRVGFGKMPKGLESTWLKKQIFNYHETKEYWSELSYRRNIKVFLTWFKYDATHCAVADGIRETGGVMAIYQRAYEGLSSPEVTTGADISFGFAPGNAELDRQANSEIQYHVSAGYVGDHRFPLLQEQATAVRRNFHEKGVKHIVAYLDENSAGDSRWLHGHHVPQRDYGFWLEKVLAEPWFGLLIKPKVPRGLREKLGPVADLLRKAEETGRCIVYDQRSGSSFGGWYPPAAVSLASDVTVHGDLAAATAGMEAALAGSPTLLFDGEGCPLSPLYRLGEGKVVFQDWNTVWEACREHWSSENGVEGFGDWSSVLDELDPFRDGRASERIGTYVHWLIQGFEMGKSREDVMADAAQRYCDIWGQDKITEIGKPGRAKAVSRPTQMA